MSNRCDECFYKWVPESGWCYMFKHEQPGCSQFRSIPSANDLSYTKTLKHLRRIGLQLMVGSLLLVAAKAIIVYLDIGSFPALDNDLFLVSTILFIVGFTIYPLSFER